MVAFEGRFDGRSFLPAARESTSLTVRHRFAAYMLFPEYHKCWRRRLQSSYVRARIGQCLVSSELDYKHPTAEDMFRKKDQVGGRPCWYAFVRLRWPVITLLATAGPYSLGPSDEDFVEEDISGKNNYGNMLVRALMAAILPQIIPCRSGTWKNV